MLTVGLLEYFTVYSQGLKKTTESSYLRLAMCCNEISHESSIMAGMNIIFRLYSYKSETE